jgi:hypothetical protein
VAGGTRRTCRKCRRIAAHAEPLAWSERRIWVGHGPSLGFIPAPAPSPRTRQRVAQLSRSGRRQIFPKLAGRYPVDQTCRSHSIPRWNRHSGCRRQFPDHRQLAGMRTSFRVLQPSELNQLSARADEQLCRNDTRPVGRKAASQRLLAQTEDKPLLRSHSRPLRRPTRLLAL